MIEISEGLTILFKMHIMDLNKLRKDSSEIFLKKELGTFTFLIIN